MTGFLEVTAGQKATVNRWCLALDHTNSIRPLVRAEGHALVRVADRAWVEGMACPSCGCTEVTAKDHPALYVSVFGALPKDAHRLRCELCGWNVTASGLLPILFESYTEREKFLETNFRGFRPQNQRFYAAQVDGKTALEDTAERAIAKVLPPQHDRTIDLCLFSALDAGMASERLHAGDVPWVSVPITAHGEVTELSWHGQEPTESEVRAMRTAKRRVAQLLTGT